jgi:glyoxylase-like metal-dependent hydrolase (beta-lactamase superfamily II)
MDRRIGDMRIRKVVEMDGLPFPADLIFPGIDPALVARGREALGPRFVTPDGGLMWSFHSYVLEAGGRRILIDTCHGNDKVRPAPVEYAGGLNTDYLGNLARLGLGPEDIDIVLCTHLHIDHVGWNTRLRDGRWVPTFPKARYLLSRPDYERFAAMPAPTDSHDQEAAVGYHSFQDSVLPVMASGQADLIETDHVVLRGLADGVWVEGAPGHTPGSVVVHAQSRDGHALFAGDVLHHPIQGLDLSVHVAGEWDVALATRTRRDLVERCCDSGTLLLPAHFPAPTAARLVSTRGGIAFDFDTP